MIHPPGFSDPRVLQQHRVQRRASSFPPRPQAGWMVFRTDLTNPEWFFYEAARAKWLSLRTIELLFTARSAIAAGSYIEATAVITCSASMGYLAAHDMTLVELEAIQGTSTAGISYRLTDDGTEIAAANILASTTSIVRTDINVDIAANSVIGAKVASEAVNPPGLFVARLRRKAS